MIPWQDYRERQKTQKMGETFISYAEYGEPGKERLIFIHGIPTWGYIFHDLATKLASDYHILVPDLPGYGFSDKRDNFDRAIDKQAAYLIQWMNEMDIEKATLIGHDIGGGIALRMALTHEHRIKRLILMNTICYDSWPVEAMIQIGHPLTKKLSPQVMSSILRQGLKLGFKSSTSSEMMDGILAPWNDKEGQISLIRNASSLNTNHTMEITPLLGEITCPVLIMWGRDDMFLNVSFARRLKEDLPNAQLVEIEKARHWVMLDQPEVVYGQLVHFLREEVPDVSEVESAPPSPS